MKTNPILRQLIYGVAFAAAYVIGLFIVPLIYGFRKPIRKNEIKPSWWFLNNTEKENRYDIDYRN